MNTTRTSGFTLVEIMIVIMIIGLLASLAFPGFDSARRNAQNAKLVNDFRIYGGAVSMFSIANGEYPADSSSGVVPPGFEDYISVGTWNNGPSIGGVWDMELDSYGIISAVGVHRFTVSLDQLVQLDEQYDDGDLSTGRYRRIANDRYYYIVAE